MKPRKYRLRIRLHRKIYDLLEMEALWQDSKIRCRTGPLRVRGWTQHPIEAEKHPEVAQRR